ncbi:hypothetical protein X975_26198, partial [Stegodyphus mimosarum]
MQSFMKSWICLPKNTFWRDYNTNAKRNVKTQKGYNMLISWIYRFMPLLYLSSVSFPWIQAHYGIPGIKAADFLAKKGVRILQRPLKSLSFHSVRLLIKRKYASR